MIKVLLTSFECVIKYLCFCMSSVLQHLLVSGEHRLIAPPLPPSPSFPICGKIVFYVSLTSLGWDPVIICKLRSSCLQLLTYGRRIPATELFARVDAVDASTIKRVANRFIFDQVGFKNIWDMGVHCYETILFTQLSFILFSEFKPKFSSFWQDVAISALGPIQTLPDYNWFRRRTYMLRY